MGRRVTPAYQFVDGRLQPIWLDAEDQATGRGLPQLLASEPSADSEQQYGVQQRAEIAARSAGQ